MSRRSMPPPRPHFRAGLYCRISKDRLAEGLGVDRQEKDLRKLARERGYVVAGVYVDNDVSASDPRVKRPSYERMLADVQAGSLDVVLAWDDDRLVRQPAELERFFTVLDAVGASYSTLTNTVDVGTGEGMLVARVKGAVAAEEVRKLSKRSRRKHEELAERGLPSGGGYRCYGYSCSRGRAITLGEATCEEPGCLHDGVTVIYAEAAVIREAADRYLAGEGFTAIARALNKAGARTSTGNEWATGTLRNLLVNPRIAGRRVHKGEIVGPAAWQPILGRATVERITSTAASRHRPGPKGPRRHVVAGLLRCSRCGQKLHAAPLNGRFSYRCTKRPGTSACGGMAISSAPVDAAVEAMTLYRLTSPTVADAIAGRPKERTHEAELLDEIARYEAKLVEAADLFADDAINAVQLRRTTTRLTEKIGAARARLSVGERAPGLLT